MLVDANLRCCDSIPLALPNCSLAASSSPRQLNTPMILRSRITHVSKNLSDPVFHLLVSWSLTSVIAVMLCSNDVLFLKYLHNP